MENRISTSKKLIIINSASTLVTRILSITVLIWIQQYLLKNISVEEYSLLPIVFSLLIFFPFFISILTGGIKRYVLVAYAANEEERITQIVSTMFPLLFLGGLFVLAVGGILAWNIDIVLRISPEYVDEARIMFILVMSLAALKVPMQAFNSGLYVQQRFVLENLIQIGCELFRLCLLFILLLGLGVSVIWVVTATVAAGAIEIFILTAVSRHLLPSQRFDRTKIDWSVAKQLTRFGGWSSLYGFSGLIRKVADPFILNRFATPLDVACFHLGALVPNRLETTISQSFRVPVSPAVIGMHSKKQYQKLKNTYLRLGRFAMWGVLLVVAPFLVHYEQLVILYVGEKYLSAGTVMFLLLACYPIVYGNILHTTLANAKLRMRSLALRESISSVLNLMLTLLLVVYYEMGAIGSAISTFVTYGLGSILLFWPFGKDMVEASWHEVSSDILLPGITPFFSALIVMQFLAVLYPADSWAAISINVIFGASAYLVALWFVAKEIDKLQFRDVLFYFFARRSIK